MYAIHRAQLLIGLQLSRSLCHVAEPSQSTSSSLARVVPTVADKLSTRYGEVQSPKRSWGREIVGTTSKPRSSPKAKFTTLKAVTVHTRRNEFPTVSPCCATCSMTSKLIPYRIMLKLQ